MRYAGFASQLQKELPDWVSAGLVTVEQSEALSLRYGAGYAMERRRSRAVQAIALIGAVAAGLGVILFFAANWDAISRPTRVVLLLAALLGSYAAGSMTLQRRPLVGHSLILLGAIAFGAGIFLVGQMYHVQAHDPLAFALWSAGVAPLAWIMRSRPLASLTLLTLGAWVVFEGIDAVGDSSYDANYLVIPLAVLLYGGALYGAGTSLGARLSWASGPMRGIGYTLAWGGTFVLTFGALHSEVEGAQLGQPMTRLLVVLGILALAGAASLLVARGRESAVWEALVLGAAATLGLATALAPAPPVATTILFNLLLAALALGAVVVGYREDELWLATSGLAVVAIDVFARFLDLSWGLLPRSTAFLGAGLLLIALAFVLERGRSRLAAGMAAR
ncbi:MAG TPA: DUF2157 domain-containing protein [Gaiellaceae bacterium]|nr:DUF2157 domain-containing protein [Gaiellaceae bacterium]